MTPYTVALTGKDTFIIDGFNIVDLADGDNSTLTHPNELMTVKSGKNGNTIYAYNQQGNLAETVLRVIRGSASDRFLNARMKALDFEPAAFVLMQGTFIKRVGNGFGFITSDTYILVGGAFFKQVDASSNSEGNVDQAVSVYSIRWGNAVRAIL
jgi:hypothetical protein